jgi:hypothetical protein
MEEDEIIKAYNSEEDNISNEKNNMVDNVFPNILLDENGIPILKKIENNNKKETRNNENFVVKNNEDKILKIEKNPNIEILSEKNSPVDIFLNDCKKEEVLMEVKLKISLPKKSLVGILKENYDIKQETISEKILDKNEDKEIKKQIIESINNYYK